MTVNQIKTFINSVRNAAFGTKETVDTLDVRGLTDLGSKVFENDENTSAFWSALIAKVGQVTVAVREYKGRTRSVKREALDWGAYVEKVSFNIGDVTDSDTWLPASTETAPESDPFNIVDSVDVESRLFKVIGTWERDQSIPDVQLKPFFNSFEQASAVISGLFISLDNALELELERVAAMAVNTHMAVTINSGNTLLARNVLAEYNKIEGTKLLVANCMYDKDFIKYVTKELKLLSDRMRDFSVLFNTAGKQRHTPKDKQVLEVLSDFATSAEMYLESDTYHKELVTLPMYETVTFWQTPGKTYDFANNSAINIKYSDEGTDKTCSFGGIIAYLHDYDAVAASVYNIRTKSIYNPKSERTNYFKKAEVGYAVDPWENGVVFYVADVTEPVTPTE